MAPGHFGLDIQPPRKRSLFRRLLGRPQPDLAVTDIRYRLATGGIVAQAEVDAVLIDYRCALADVAEPLDSLLNEILGAAVADGTLSSNEVSVVHALADAFRVPRERLAALQHEAALMAYRRFFDGALTDQRFDDAEKKRLSDIASTLGLSEADQDAVRRAAASDVLTAMMTTALADGRFEDDEEHEIQVVAKSLDVSFTHERETADIVKRARQLAAYARGDLPRLDDVPVRLPKAEVCHWAERAHHLELRTVTTQIRHAGVTASFRLAKGLRLRSGVVNVERVTTDVMTPLSDGTLYFTNRRLLFTGTRKNTTILWNRVVSVSHFSDALGIHKDSGKPQYFRFDGLHDPQFLSALVDGIAANIGRVD